MNKKNKVRYNLKNVHWAPLTISTDGTPSWGTPVHIPGAVSIALEHSGDPEPFFADGIAYYIVNNNQGYSGDLEMALLPDDFRQYALSEKIDTNGVVVENSNWQLRPFALLFEFDGDAKSVRHVLYNCTTSRPNIEGKTKEESIEVKTETMTITASPLDSGLVKSRTSPDTDREKYNAWYSQVYEPEIEFSVAPTTLSLEAGGSGTVILNDAEGTVTAAVTKESAASEDLTVEIDGDEATITAEEDATGTYTVTFTDPGSTNTATVTVTIGA